MSSLPVRRRSQVRFSVPEPIPQGLGRPRLQEQLTDLTIKVAVLLAPSGYGKTVLLAQWARQQNGDVIWLKLHQEDRVEGWNHDRHGFFMTTVLSRRSTLHTVSVIPMAIAGVRCAY